VLPFYVPHVIGLAETDHIEISIKSLDGSFSLKARNVVNTLIHCFGLSVGRGCRVIGFRANEVRLQLSVLAYNLANLWRRLVLPARIATWSLTSLQQRLVKTGGRLVKHARY
jgi:Transposase DDE domain group 1